MEADLLLSEDLSALSNDHVIESVVAFTAHMNAAEYRLIRLVDELDRRHGICGTDSIPAWLGYYCGIDGNAAREKLRVARALRELPDIRACFAEGKISYSKVRAITRIADEANEKLLLSYSLNATAAQMEHVVRGYRRAERIHDPEAVLRQRKNRGLSWWWDDDGLLVIEGRLSPEDGALFIKAIEAVCERMKQDEGAAESEDLNVKVHGELDADALVPIRARRADALVEILEAGLGNVDAELPGGDRTLVVMHVPVSAGPGAGETQEQNEAQAGSAHPLTRTDDCALEEGPAVPHGTARRIACDASVVTHHEHADGRVASIGRRSRTVPWWLRHALKHRDGGCRFPGCNRTRHVDAHHIVHWAEGGATFLDNLVLLCRHHHRVIHEEQVHIRRATDGDAGGEADFVFVAADGRPLPKTFPQKPGSCRELVRVNVQRGLEIDGSTGRTGSGYTARPDYNGSISSIWSKSHGEYRAPPREDAERSASRRESDGAE